RQLPGGWRAAHGALAGDTTHVVSAGAYLAGLQWKAARAHAPGGDPTGFGSWAEPAPEAIR
ncbi:MAG: hypothetical protein KC613_03485, partial [Myxococcales bacterium]|nr:hypothetical protein [Myxococcales bacterium]